MWEKTKMISRFYTNRNIKNIWMSLLFCLAGFSVFGQNQDSLSIDNITLCQCYKYSSQNEELRKLCDAKWDYNAMDAYSRMSFKRELEVCEDPSVCDCKKLSEKDSALNEICKIEHDTTKMDEDELYEYHRDYDNCIVIARTEKSLDQFCKCINSDMIEKDEFRNCLGFYDLSELTDSARTAFMEKTKGCIDNKDDENYALTICQCINAPKSNTELKQRCITKFNIDSLTQEELKELQNEAQDCEQVVGGNGNTIAEVCECIHQMEGGGMPSEHCMKLMQKWEGIFKSATPEERAIIMQQIMDCAGDILNRER